MPVATTFDNFGCNVFSDNPATPDNLTPNVTINRRGFDTINKPMPDGSNLRFWAFRDPAIGAGTTPAPIIRVRQNQIIHTHMDPNTGTHTIHHHGIEPTPMNDGVGHTSFEVSGNGYAYQWRPAYAGTYFYHCHKNTTLHFENGMYGALIVDPASGLRRLYDPATGDTNSVDTTYDVEAIQAIDDVDPVFHGLGHDDGLCGQDAGLNNFRPRWFMINGVGHPTTLTAAGVAITMRVNQRLLLRMINASYSVVSTTISGLSSQIVGCDGRAMRTNAALGDFGAPVTVAAGAPIISTAAQRLDLLIRPTVIGTYTIQHDFLNWITGVRDTRAGGVGIAQTRITVTA